MSDVWWTINFLDGQKSQTKTSLEEGISSSLLYFADIRFYFIKWVFFVHYTAVDACIMT